MSTVSETAESKIEHTERHFAESNDCKEKCCCNTTNKCECINCKCIGCTCAKQCKEEKLPSKYTYV